MMTINITIIVQMLNFGIAYALLYSLFFKPTVALLHDEQESYRAIENIIVSGKAVCLEKEQELDMQVQSCKQFFKDHKPRVQDLYLVVLKELTPSITPQPLDAQSIKQATEHIKQALIKRVEHVS